MLRSNGFHLIALSGSCSLLAIASPALAQQTAGGEANVSEQVEQQAPGGEIVVTATRGGVSLMRNVLCRSNLPLPAQPLRP